MTQSTFSVKALVKGVAVVALLACLGLVAYNLWPRQYESFDLSSVKAVDTSEQHTLILLEDGTLWGVGDGQHQRLGITSSSPLLSEVNSSTGDRYTKRPVRIMGDVIQAEAGYNFSLALKSDNSLWGFGYNVDYELGVDTGSTTQKPGVKPMKLMDGVVQIASGGGVHSFALKQDGSLWGFGRNLNGQLGIALNVGSYTGITAPEKVMDNVQKVFCGDANSFVIKTDGSLWSMGLNVDGELGYAPTQETNSTPQKIADNVVAVSAYEKHTLLLTEDGVALGMGDNSANQLGVSIPKVSVPVKIAEDVKSIAVGRAHSLVIKEDKSLWGMGDNSQGQLGSENPSNVPQLTKLLDNVVGVSSAADHTLIMTESGELLAWGSNASGQIGLPGFFVPED